MTMKNKKTVQDLIEKLVTELTSECEAKAPRPEGRPVLVTTVHRGVFFGYLQGEAGAMVKLKRARNVLYWSADVKGFIGLADMGPSSACRIGPAADVELRDITAVVESNDKAALAFEAAPWAK